MFKDITQMNTYINSSEQKTDNELLLSIRKHVEKYGFGAVIPELTTQLSPDVFLEHYYDKKTLQSFCRDYNIPSHGLKGELTQRIEMFLRTGEIPDSNKKLRKTTGSPDSQLGLTLDRQVVNYKSDLATRVFFAKHIPKFSGFSAYVQKWLKQRLSNDEKFTYAEIIEKHKQFLQEKLTRSIKLVAHDSCQFNQFLIDYSQDKNGIKPHSAKDAWKLVRDTAGHKTYIRYKEEIQKIIKILKDKDGR